LSSFELVVGALADLGFDSFVLLDKAEPEFKTFASLLSTGFRPGLVALLGVCTGLIDYQLAEGGATKLWKEVESLATKVEIAKVDDIRHCMELLLLRPVCSLYNEQKARRIARLFSSGVPANIVDDFAECVGQPDKLWKTIAMAVQSPPEKKTIAFAMKAFDLAVFPAREGIWNSKKCLQSQWISISGKSARYSA
jgi:N-glycosylase/DNA lyase